MSLIKKFEEMPFQDVGTFNSIFVNNPILNISSNEEVKIGELTNDNKRKVYVLDKVLTLDLTNTKVKINKPTVRSQKPKRKRVEKKTIKLNPLMKKLTPSQFVIYHAINEAGEILGMAELSRNIRLTVKSIYVNLETLVKIGLVKKEQVASDRGALTKLTIDTNFKTA